jgi:hypothetical protein
MRGIKKVNGLVSRAVLGKIERSVHFGGSEIGRPFVPLNPSSNLVRSPAFTVAERNNPGRIRV